MPDTKMMMLREGRIIFNGSDESLHIRGPEYPGISVTVMLIDILT